MVKLFFHKWQIEVLNCPTVIRIMTTVIRMAMVWDLKTDAFSVLLNRFKVLTFILNSYF